MSEYHKCTLTPELLLFHIPQTLILRGLLLLSNKPPCFCSSPPLPLVHLTLKCGLLGAQIIQKSVSKHDPFREAWIISSINYRLKILYWNPTKRAAIYQGFLGDGTSSILEGFGQLVFWDFLYFSKHWLSWEPRHLQPGCCSPRNPPYKQHDIITVDFLQPTSLSKQLNSVGLQQNNITVNILSKRYRVKNCITVRRIN